MAPAVLRLVHCLWFTIMMYGMELRLLRKPGHLLQLQLQLSLRKQRLTIKQLLNLIIMLLHPQPHLLQSPQLPAKNCLPNVLSHRTTCWTTLSMTSFATAPRYAARRLALIDGYKV